MSPLQGDKNQLAQQLSHSKNPEGPWHRNNTTKPYCSRVTSCSGQPSLVQVQIPRLPLGKIWDYYGQVPETAWLAAPEKLRASDVQSWLRQITLDAWYCPVHCQGCRRRHSAVLHERLPHRLPPARKMGQVVTTIFPPLFVWADARYLTRAWCVWATTYNEAAQSCITMVDIVQA